MVPLLDAARVQASAALPWRAELLIEGCFADAALKLGWAPYVAVHTGRHVYVETEGDRPELYDLSTDPYQQHNQMGNPDYKTIATDLKSRLKRLLPASAALPQR